MSLSKLLEEDKDLSAYLRETFPKPKLRAKPPLFVEPICANNWLVGHAVDYVMRWMLERANDQLPRGWTAMAAIARLRPRLRSKARAIVDQALEEYEKFRRREDVPDALIGASLRLARLDTVYRTGLGGSDIGVSPDPSDIADVRNVIAAIPPGLIRKYDRCVLNPTFGVGSRMVGGADADLLLDGHLIEIKTTKRFEIERFTFNQLLGYVLLAKIGGVNGNSEEPLMRSIAVYLARFGCLVEWSLPDIAPDSAFEEAAGWMQRRYGRKQVV